MDGGTGRGHAKQRAEILPGALFEEFFFSVI